MRRMWKRRKTKFLFMTNNTILKIFSPRPVPNRPSSREYSNVRSITEPDVKVDYRAEHPQYTHTSTPLEEYWNEYNNNRPKTRELCTR